MHTDLGQGDVLVELLDAAGVAPVLRLPPLGRRHHDSLWTFNVGGGFVSGSQYKLRVAERDVVGSYSLSFAERESVTLWQRFLALFLVMAMASGGSLAWVRLGPRRAAWRGRSLHILWPVLVMSLGIAYAILHESGHNIGLWLFGALGILHPDSDFRGFVSHVGVPLWVSRTFLAAAGLVTIGLSAVVGRHVLSVLRSGQQAFCSNRLSSNPPPARKPNDTNAGSSNHRSERERATSVANTDAWARPSRLIGSVCFG